MTERDRGNRGGALSEGHSGPGRAPVSAKIQTTTMSDEDSGSERGNQADAQPEAAASSEDELEGSKKIRFRSKSSWKQVASWPKEGKSEEELQALILQAAKDQLQPWIPEYLEDYKRLDTDLYAWKRKEGYCTSKGIAVVVYRCPLHHSCDCESALRVIRSETAISVEIKVEHNADSHKNSSVKRLNHKHKEAVIRLVRGDPSLSSTAVRRQCQGSSEIPLDYQRSVAYLCRKERKKVIAREFEGVELDGSIGSFQLFSRSEGQAVVCHSYGKVPFQ